MTAAPAWATPGDPGGYLAHQLMLVKTGRKSRAAGIRRCPDCTEPFIDDHTGLTHCPDCRTAYRRHCADCRAPMTNTAAGDRLCLSCQNQLVLFPTERMEPTS
ncbi:MAG: hypothetical protein ACRDRK_00760 [Pseudonocardia sp.]